MNKIRHRIVSVIKKHPTINAFGFGAYDHRRLTPKKAQQRIEEGQEELLERADEVTFVVEWLSDVKKTKAIDRRCGSYGLKHTAEQSSPKGYISNGAFIAAAIIAGFTAQKSGPNAFFNMSLTSLKQKTTGRAKARA